MEQKKRKKGLTKKEIRLILTVILIIAATIYSKCGGGLLKTSEQKEEGQVKQVATEEQTTTPETDSNLTAVTVEKVVDGDTLTVNLNGKSEKLRFIGVDTPESVHRNTSRNTEAGKIASNYTKSKLSNKTIWLEFDAGERDRYGRLLAYVYLDANGNSMYNEELLAKGYARTMTIQPNVKYADRFVEVQKKAQAEKAGFWDDENAAWK